MTAWRSLRAALFALLGLALFLAIWEIYKNVGPARGVQWGISEGFPPRFCSIRC